MAMIYVDDVFMSESGDFADFVVRLDGPSAQAISVQYATFDREASRFSDYTTTTGTLGFAVGADRLLDRNADRWIQEGKTWLGLVFGLNLN